MLQVQGLAQTRPGVGLDNRHFCTPTSLWPSHVLLSSTLLPVPPVPLSLLQVPPIHPSLSLL